MAVDLVDTLPQPFFNKMRCNLKTCHPWFVEVKGIIYILIF